jgi:Carboxypeptidase regulatory-like domain
MRIGHARRFGQKTGRALWTRKVALSAALIVVPVLLATLPAGAAPSGTGSLSGRVQDGSGNPLSGICVAVENGPSVQSDLSGQYEITGLDAGSYKVGFSDCNATPHYLPQWYLNHPDAGSADSLAVMNGMATPVPNVTLALGVTITGTVTDQQGAPIEGISVNATPTGPGPTGGSVTTDMNGVYATAPLAAGDYKVQFSDNRPTPTYASEYWKDEPSWSTSDTVTLKPDNGPTQSGIDAQLSFGATVQGHVTNSDGDPLGGICVDANASNHNGGWDWISGVQTDSNGDYSIGGLPARDLRMHFRDCQSGPYAEEWYAGQTNPDSATPVVLAEGETRTGIDAQLDRGIAVSGTVTDADGNPISGISVNVNPVDQGSNAWAQTDSAGHYTTNALPPGDYRVQFQDSGSSPQWASEYWDGQSSQRTAKTLTLSNADLPVRTNVNATLARAATVSGTVTGPDGAPLKGMCVSAVVDTPDGPDGVGNASTGPDGTYVMGGLPATDVRVVFQDCSNRGPYVTQWWHNQPSFDSAATLTLESGATRNGIDAQLAAAGQISGRITDHSGNPLEGVCAQATTSTNVGGIAHSDSDGRYTINLSQAGAYQVQFVDCNQTPKFANQWWDHETSRANAKTVNVAPGHVVSHINAALDEGSVGSVSGKVTNLNGVAMTSVCVVVYLPNQYALFGLVGSDGTYSVPNVPSGTYALAFLDCSSGGDPGAIIQDPQSPTTSYHAVWWAGVPVQLSNGDGGPDPIAQHATLITVQPGQDLTGYNWCFGCTAIQITSVTPVAGGLTVAFTTPGLLPAGVQSMAIPNDVDAAATGFTYTVTCTSPTGVTGSASGPGSPITVTGLTPGASYTCKVTASDGAMTVASSSDSVAVVSASDGTATVPVGTSTGGSSGSVGAQMARTGANSAVQAFLGLAFLGFGLVLMVLGRNRRSRRVSTVS